MTDDTRELLRRMAEVSPGAITRVIPFTNDDVPKYLENLRRFRAESRKVVITIT